MNRIQEFLQSSAIAERIVTPQFDAADGESVDLSQALSDALAQPMLYPPLGDAIFPGDRVAVALQSGMPHPRHVLETLIRQLERLGIESTDLIVVISALSARQLGIEPVTYEHPEETREDHPPKIFAVDVEGREIQFQVHDRGNAAGLAYLNANRDGDPIYVNRQLVDADVVLPVGFADPGPVNRQPDCIYPEFSAHYAQTRMGASDASEKANREETEMANEMLGAFCTVQLVMGPGNQVRQVLCGERRQTLLEARIQSNELWKFPSQEQAEGIIGTIESSRGEQRWEQLVDAVRFLDSKTVGDGPLIVLTELSSNPTGKIKQAFQASFDGSPTNRLPGWLVEFSQILSRRQVFLASQLGPTATEDLGLGHLTTNEELERICKGFESLMLVRDAHQCQHGEGPAEAEATPQEIRSSENDA